MVLSDHFQVFFFFSGNALLSKTDQRAKRRKKNTTQIFVCFLHASWVRAKMEQKTYGRKTPPPCLDSGDITHIVNYQSESTCRKLEKGVETRVVVSQSKHRECRAKRVKRLRRTPQASFYPAFFVFTLFMAGGPPKPFLLASGVVI